MLEVEKILVEAKLLTKSILYGIIFLLMAVMETSRFRIEEKRTWDGVSRGLPLN